METMTSNGHHTSTEQQEASQGDLQSQVEQSAATQVNVGDLERALSVVAGGACIIMAPSRSIWGTLITLTGCGLMYRAMTGHCFVYQSLDMNTANRQ
jgi:uncharacterized membrane protein